jgi:putative membrane protein
MEQGATDRSGGPGQAFYGRPFLWLLFALLLSAVPLAGYMREQGMQWNEVHPAINAVLNGVSGVFLVAGWLAIRRRRIALHRSCMVAAFASSTLFLGSYLLRFALSGSHRYPGTGWDRSLYLTVLFSHMVLAAVLVPMVLRTLYLALRGRFEPHRGIARWTWPIWIYVSVTGVLVYLMLYPLAQALYGR